MKKIFFIALLLIIIGGIWYASKKDAKPEVVNTAPVTTGGHPSLKNASFTFDSDTITLKNGKSSTKIDAASAESIDTELTEFVAYGNLNTDEDEDAAALIIQSGTGSGTFLYVAAYISGPVTYKGTNAVFIGDRVEPKSISIKNNIITVSYLDRKDGEPMSADPTVPTTKQYSYSALDNTLSEK